jgi:hypothetical protein
MQNRKEKTDLNKGIFRGTLIPLSLAPFFPIIAIIGNIGSSRL